jgi:hypothetical protein
MPQLPNPRGRGRRRRARRRPLFADGLQIAAGDTYTTSDERVAARLAADPALEEVQKP